MINHFSENKKKKPASFRRCSGEQWVCSVLVVNGGRCEQAAPAWEEPGHRPGSQTLAVLAHTETEESQRSSCGF